MKIIHSKKMWDAVYQKLASNLNMNFWTVAS